MGEKAPIGADSYREYRSIRWDARRALYAWAMELRQLEVFVTVATELHFGRAAERLHMGQPTVSELVRRLEREVGTPLLTRTTRRVALTSSGLELLSRANGILDDVASAVAAVRRVAGGETGIVHVGMTPPVSLTLAPHLQQVLRTRVPDIELVFRRRWLPDLNRAVAEGDDDVLITCGVVPESDGVVGEVFCAEPLLVGLRSDHELAGEDVVALTDLAGDTLGIPSGTLFPAWALAQRQALDRAGISPPTVELAGTDVAAAAWPSQPEVDWIVTTASLTATPVGTVMRPTTPALVIPYTLQWNPRRTQSAAAARFVDVALTAEVPAGWCTQPCHLHHHDHVAR